jgi:hypothetical protein
MRSRDYYSSRAGRPVSDAEWVTIEALHKKILDPNMFGMFFLGPSGGLAVDGQLFRKGKGNYSTDLDRQLMELGADRSIWLHSEAKTKLAFFDNKKWGLAAAVDPKEDDCSLFVKDLLRYGATTAGGLDIAMQYQRREGDARALTPQEIGQKKKKTERQPRLIYDTYHKLASQLKVQLTALAALAALATLTALTGFSDPCQDLLPGRLRGYRRGHGRGQPPGEHRAAVGGHANSQGRHLGAEAGHGGG